MKNFLARSAGFLVDIKRPPTHPMPPPVPPFLCRPHHLHLAARGEAKEEESKQAKAANSESHLEPLKAKDPSHSEAPPPRRPRWAGRARDGEREREQARERRR